VIVRILGEGQYELPAEELAALENLDQQLNSAIEAGDEGRFDAVLAELTAKIRQGRELPASTIVPSELTVPHEGSTLDELRRLLSEEDPDTEAVTEGA
jgi:hypothetical protein